MLASLTISIIRKSVQRCCRSLFFWQCKHVYIHYVVMKLWNNLNLFYWQTIDVLFSNILLLDKQRQFLSMNNMLCILFFFLIYEATFLLIFNVNYSEERLLMIPRKQYSGSIHDNFNIENKVYGQVKYLKFKIKHTLSSNKSVLKKSFS